MSNIKLYLVRFEHREGKEPTLHKFGVTHHYDVLDRFKGDSYDGWYISVVCSAYGPRALVLAAEQHLLSLYPKNLWVDGKFSGITEVVRMKETDVDSAKILIENYRHEWYNMRTKETNE